MVKVASMVAIFAFLVPICRESFATVGTSEGIECFSVNILKVTVPPGSPAGGGAKQPGFLLGNDFYVFTALLAINGVFWFLAQTITAAKGAYGIVRQV